MSSQYTRGGVLISMLMIIRNKLWLAQLAAIVIFDTLIYFMKFTSHFLTISTFYHFQLLCSNFFILSPFSLGPHPPIHDTHNQIVSTDNTALFILLNHCLYKSFLLTFKQMFQRIYLDISTVISTETMMSFWPVGRKCFESWAPVFFKLSNLMQVNYDTKQHPPRSNNIF